MPFRRPRRPASSRTSGARPLPWLVVPALVALLASGCGGPTGAGQAAPSAPASASSGAPSSAPPAPPSRAAEPAADPGFQAPRVGQCTQLTPRQSRATVARGARVGCDQQHTSVVAHVGFLPRPLTPASPVEQLRRVGQRICEPAYRRVAGGTLADRATSVLTWTLFTPSQAQLERGARWVRCDVLARSGDQLVPLPTGRPPLLAQGVPEQLRVCQAADGRDISCGERHAYRVEAVFRAAGTAYPDTAAFTATARSRCQELTRRTGGFWQPPSPAGWQDGDRFVRCLSAGS